MGQTCTVTTTLGGRAPSEQRPGTVIGWKPPANPWWGPPPATLLLVEFRDGWREMLDANVVLAGVERHRQEVTACRVSTTALAPHPCSLWLSVHSPPQNMTTEPSDAAGGRAGDHEAPPDSGVATAASKQRA